MWNKHLSYLLWKKIRFFQQFFLSTEILLFNWEGSMFGFLWQWLKIFKWAHCVSVLNEMSSETVCRLTICRAINRRESSNKSNSMNMHKCSSINLQFTIFLRKSMIFLLRCNKISGNHTMNETKLLNIALKMFTIFHCPQYK